MITTKQTLTELKNKLCITHTYCPCFEGFYETSLSSIMDISEWDLFDNANAVNEDLQRFIVTEADCAYFDHRRCEIDISKNIIDYFNDYFKENDLMVKFKFESLYSPKEYNFSTNSINIKVVYTTDFIRFLNDYTHKYINEFKEFIKNRYTSRSGFISYYSNNYIDWFEFLNKDTLIDNENMHILGCFLDFYFNNENDDINEYIYDYVYEKMRSNSCITEYLNYDALIDAVNKKFNLNIGYLEELEK